MSQVRDGVPGRSCGLLARVLLICLVAAAPLQADPVRDELGALLENLGEPKRNFLGVGEDDLSRQRVARSNFSRLQREKAAGHWYAALLASDPDDEFAILERYASRDEMAFRLSEREAVVEVWTYESGGEPARRLTARELSQRAGVANPQPVLLTATYRDPQDGVVKASRLDFGLRAAAMVQGEERAYQRHRLRQSEIRRVLGARNSEGVLSARAQWEALAQSVRRGIIPLAELPPAPGDDRDFLVACECVIDERSQIQRVVRVYRASQISHRVVGGGDGLLLKSDDSVERFAVAVGEAEGSELPLPGRDAVRIRVKETGREPSRWNVLEFGETWVLRETALAQMGLVSAHLENQRKELAWQKSNIDRFAEPLFAGLNIGGGLAGAGTPLGEAARLAYNLIVTRSLTPNVPSARELEGLFRYMAARSLEPASSRVPGKLLSQSQVTELRKTGEELSEQEVEDALRVLTDDDLRVILSFPKWQNMDQKYRLVADILTDLGKVTGRSESGILKDIFNNSRLSPNGELSLTTTIAVALGREDLTPLSGVSLEQLGRGDGPVEAWLQYLNLTVDLRTIANTLSLAKNRAERDRELLKPFPHAPRVTDLAAFEIRLFGYPTLFWYKRGLLKDDLEAFRNDFAYGISGTRVVKRFATQNEFLAEMERGRLTPIGFARIPEGLRRAGRESNLPVFGYRVSSGPHAGRTAIVIFGMKAYRAHAAFMGREMKRFRQFEQIMSEGGVIRRMIEAEGADELPRAAFEPELWVGEDASTGRFNALLEDLLEYQRLHRFDTWGVPLTPADRAEKGRLSESLRKRGVDVQPGGDDPLLKVDAHFSSFVYRGRQDGHERKVQMISIPSSNQLARSSAAGREKQLQEAIRRKASGSGENNP